MGRDRVAAIQRTLADVPRTSAEVAEAMRAKGFICTDLGASLSLGAMATTRLRPWATVERHDGKPTRWSLTEAGKRAAEGDR